MQFFISDLDNTLIYSYKKNIGEDKVLVETKEKKELSYMTGYTYRHMNFIAKQYCFVPMTTRSLEQYQRIIFPKQWKPEYALVSNGGILLHHGSIEKQWYVDSLQLIETAQKELEQVVDVLKKDINIVFEVRKVDGLFVFTKSEDVEKTIYRLQESFGSHEEIHSEKEQNSCLCTGIQVGKYVSIFRNGSKVYALPRELNKGMALKRLKAFTGIEYAIGAGDSEFDLPMLLESDVALLPESLVVEKGEVLKQHPNKMIVPENTIFSDAIIRYLGHFV